MATGRGIRSSSETETPEISEYHDDTASDTSEEPRSDTDSDDGLFRYPHGIYRLRTPPGFLLSRNYENDVINYSKFKNTLDRVLSKFGLEFDSCIFADYLLSKAGVTNKILMCEFLETQDPAPTCEFLDLNAESLPRNSGTCVDIKLCGVTPEELEPLSALFIYDEREYCGDSNTTTIVIEADALYKQITCFERALHLLSAEDLDQYRLDPIEIKKLREILTDLTKATINSTSSFTLGAFGVLHDLYESAFNNYHAAAIQFDQSKKNHAKNNLLFTLETIMSIHDRHGSFKSPDISIAIANIIKYLDYIKDPVSDINNQNSPQSAEVNAATSSAAAAYSPRFSFGNESGSAGVEYKNDISTPRPTGNKKP